MSEREPVSPEPTEQVDDLFRDAEELAARLLRENNELRAKIAEYESKRESSTLADQQKDASQLPRQLKDALSTLGEERNDARGRLHKAELKNQQLAARCVQVETESDTLGNLYVATQQLHGTLDLNELMNILVEVAINLVGAEMLAVYLYDETRRKLVPFAADGEEVEAFPIIEIGEGPLGEAVETGEIRSIEATSTTDLAKPIVCIPFQHNREPIGALAIYQLLRQKAGLTPLDHELFSLLAGHASTALYAARIYSESKRKLDTMEGFLDLMQPTPRGAVKTTSGVRTN